jgi:hypothetical protein
MTRMSPGCMQPPGPPIQPSFVRGFIGRTVISPGTGSSAEGLDGVHLPWVPFISSSETAQQCRGARSSLGILASHTIPGVFS